jgi:RimJ/RimL family protein N-acetyltransferase
VSCIETERLLIRTWRLPADADDTAEMFGDPEAMRFIPSGVLSPEGAAAAIARMIERYEADGFGIWPVVLKETKKPIGECGILYIPGTRDVQVAWLFKRSAWGNGFATEAARAVLDYAFSEIGLTRIYALIDRENRASIAIAHRLCMAFDRIVRVGRRDLMRYVLTRPDTA